MVRRSLPVLVMMNRSILPFPVGAGGVEGAAGCGVGGAAGAAVGDLVREVGDLVGAAVGAAVSVQPTIRKLPMRVCQLVALVVW